MFGKFLFVLIMTMVLAGFAFGEVSVTVYNSNLGVVKDSRELEFQKGIGKVSFTDVPSQIDATSVGFEVADPGKNVTILEQNYAYDLVSPDKIYNKYIDKTVDLFDEKGNIYSGMLLAFNGGAVTLKNKDGKIQIIRMEQIVNANFPELPEGLITRPTLFWLYNSDFNGKAQCDVTYQTSGIKWSAEYVGLLSEDEKKLHLSGWSSIENNSGATFEDATLKLVAGDIHRAQVPPPMAKGRQDMLAMAEKASGFEQKQFFEYHLYTLPRKATLANNEIKQISLFEPASTSVEKEYLYQPDQSGDDVKVMLKFVNSGERGLGMPLPAGRTRVFKADSDGSMVLLGEDRIDHTPKDEEVRLNIGNAFDIVAEQKTTNVTRVSERVTETEYEIELRNRKDDNITVTVEKSLYGDWQILNSNYDYKKKDAYNIRFDLPVDANSKTNLKFTVRITR